jgi:hypothetical protein
MLHSSIWLKTPSYMTALGPGRKTRDLLGYISPIGPIDWDKIFKGLRSKSPGACRYRYQALMQAWAPATNKRSISVVRPKTTEKTEAGDNDESYPCQLQTGPPKSNLSRKMAIIRSSKAHTGSRGPVNSSPQNM